VATLDQGVIHRQSTERAAQAGMFTVMDRCRCKDRAALR
jgi:predicted CoA-binding protein